ncbi:MAG TPA: DNA-processing protein DprA [Alphaproteobacteria bacterium]
MAEARRELSRDERIDWLRLARSENVGPATFFALMRHFGSAAEAIARAPGLSVQGGRSRPIRIVPRAEAEREIEAVEGAGARLVAWGEPAYPEPLAAIHDPPPLIAVAGHAHLLSARTVAVVGARNASAAGRRFAHDISSALGRAKLVVVSGLARGIDAAAHEGALATGTVAVVAGGIDVAYPPDNAALQERIAREGALVSEQPFGTRPIAQHFPRRNRLISGLSLGVLVVEAAQRSGSLITARMALEQGREVFAVPGSPLDPRCRGCNELIRKGAVLTEQAEDVLDALDGILSRPLGEPGGTGFRPREPEIPEESELARARPAIVEALGPTPVTVDEVVRQCQLSAAVAITVLLELELAGRLERHPGNKVSLIL